MRQINLRRVVRDARANVAVMAAIAMIPILIAVGIAVDTSRQISLKGHAQTMADAGALAAVRSIDGNDMDLTQMRDIAKSSIIAHLDWIHSENYCYFNAGWFEINRADLSATVSLQCTVPTMFSSRLMGKDKMRVNVSSTAAARFAIAEVALMFDLSDSMNATELGHLRDAGKRVAEIIIGPDDGRRGRVSIVPFASGVNAGEFGNIAAGRARGDDPEGDDDYDPASHLAVKSRTCVTERIGPEAATDAAPVGSNTVGPPLTMVDAFRSPIPAHQSDFVCPESQIVPLSGDLDDIKTAIDGLEDTRFGFRWAGSTAGHLGILWSWYTLSPNWETIWTDTRLGGSADARPSPYGDPNRPKIAILMSDGGFDRAFRGDAYSTNTNTADTVLATFAEDVCENMRDAGVEVYTVYYGSVSPGANFMETCAGRAENFYRVDRADDLTDVYESIAAQYLGIAIVS
ncbi:MAG: Tad domain-containing protein [Pseudomonadota bacterium]